MKKKFFIGVDVSKYTLDVAYVERSDEGLSLPEWKQFDNSHTGIKEMKGWLIQKRVTLDERVIVVMENTGVYHRLLWNSLSQWNVDVCVENAAHIKWSMGIVRGKSDRIDSRRLCIFAAQHSETLKPCTATGKHIVEIKDLLTIRTNMIVHLKALTTSLNELYRVVTKATQKVIKQTTAEAIKGLERSIKKVESQIKETIREEEQINEMYKLITSVPGIGKVTAAYLISHTNMFSYCRSGKQLACYCGVVPFEYQSGSSIKGKTHVHKMANKEIKRLLHLCALSAIQHYKEFKTYYERKKQEGKHVLSILNAIKNKLILRVFAVVRNKEIYVDKSLSIG